MAALAPLLIPAAALLVLAGVPKVLRPLPAVRALRSVGVRVPAGAIRLGGLVEAAVGIATLTVGGRWLAAAVAASYAGFSGFLVVALRRDGVVSSCGCIGRADTPPTIGHLLVTAGFAVGCAVAAGADPRGPFEVPWDAAAVTTTAFAALAVWLCYLVFAVAPLARLPRPDVEAH